MMFKIFRLIFYSFLVSIIFSCTKSEEKYFHGRITYDCNQTPVPNASVSIYRVYDTGSMQGATIGGCKTDPNGYYFLLADVDLEGSLDSYEIDVEASPSSFSGRQNGFCSNSYESNNIEINCALIPRSAYSFHIVNTTPHDSSDVFNSLTISYPNSSYNDEILITNLTGINIDTMIFINRYYIPLTYKVAYTKNGLHTETLLDSIAPPICLDTMRTDIFY